MGVYDSIESFAAEQGWVVKYAADGTPNFFYPIPKMKSSDLDPSLPNHTHPAFIINGVEVDRRLIGVYKTADFNSAGHSIPNCAPLTNIGTDQILARIKACGTGFGVKTCADSGLLLLLARKLGYTTIKGNTTYGVDHRDGTAWAAGKSFVTGDETVFQGVLYTALSDHTSALENKPDISPTIWQRGRRIGGIPSDNKISDSNPNGLITLTGTGPISWRFGGKVNGIDDLCGNTAECDYGYRLVDGEIQIIENNNAAHPNTDLSADSAQWRAILPNSTSSTYTLVAPGTTGTLHWNVINSKLTLDTVTTATGTNHINFNSVTANTINVPFVPYIMYELGLFPLPGDTTHGEIYIDLSDTMAIRRGGNYNSLFYSGLGYSRGVHKSSYNSALYGARSAYVENLES